MDFFSTIETRSCALQNDKSGNAIRWGRQRRTSKVALIGGIGWKASDDSRMAILLDRPNQLEVGAQIGKEGEVN